MKKHRKYGGRKRAISEVVTVVSLTALAVAMGVIVTVWYTRSSEKQTSETLGTFEIAAECAEAKYNIIFDKEKCEIGVFNNGVFKIDRIKAEFYYNDGSKGLQLIETPILPKGTALLDKSKFMNLKKMQVIPTLTIGGKQVACLSEQEFTPADLSCIGATQAVCGDGKCEAEMGETTATCCDDCTCTAPQVCVDHACIAIACDNDNTCEAGETLETCPNDCKCGNEVCDAGETYESCPTDCKCGDGTCGTGENCGNCITDCACKAPNAQCVSGTCRACNPIPPVFPNAGCAQPTPYCSPTTYTCVQCNSDANCASPTPKCVKNTCVECTKDADCTHPSTPKCIISLNNCGCTADADCASFWTGTKIGGKCLNPGSKDSMCVDCLSKDDCSSIKTIFPVCGTSSCPYTCTCNNKYDCPAIRPVCTSEHGESCGMCTCTNNGDCPAGYYCTKQEKGSECVKQAKG